MTAYYNEIDPKAAAWLRELIRCGHIAPGEVDERDIRDVRPADLHGFAQCHAQLNGSDLCEVIWKTWNTPWGQRRSRPRARVRTISETATGLWLTPHCPRQNDSDETAGKFYPSKKQIDIAAQATWATPASPWPTPTSLAPAKNGNNEAGNSAGLVAIRKHALAIWPTATASTNDGDPAKKAERRAAAKAKWKGVSGNGMGYSIAEHARFSSGSSEQTEKPGGLNPEFVCWLMGYPAEWVSCGALAMQSTQGRLRRSSAPISGDAT